MKQDDLEQLKETCQQQVHGLQRATSCKFQRKQLSKRQTVKETKEFVRLCNVANYAKNMNIWAAPLNKAIQKTVWERYVFLVEKLSERQIPNVDGSIIGPIKDLRKNLVKLVWVNACTNEVQNCRQMAAINSVILKESRNRSGEKILLFLEDWELVRAALSFHVAFDMFCREMHEAWWLVCCCLKKKPLSQHESHCFTMEGL